MTENAIENGGLTERHKALIQSATTPLPLDEGRIARTLEQARSFVKRRARARLWMFRIVPIVLAVGLLAAGVWRWSGRDSRQTLSYEDAISVMGNPGSYTFENVRAAAGSLWRQTDGLLKDMATQGAMTPGVRQAVLRAIDGPQVEVPDHPGGFEELEHAIGSGRALSREEESRLVKTLQAGIHALRSTAGADPRHQTYVNEFRNRLRETVTPADTGSQESRHD